MNTKESKDIQRRGVMYRKTTLYKSWNKCIIILLNEKKKILMKFSEYQDFLKSITSSAYEKTKSKSDHKALLSLRTQLSEMDLPLAFLRPQRRLCQC